MRAVKMEIKETAAAASTAAASTAPKTSWKLQSTSGTYTPSPITASPTWPGAKPTSAPRDRSASSSERPSSSGVPGITGRGRGAADNPHTVGNAPSLPQERAASALGRLPGPLGAATSPSLLPSPPSPALPSCPSAENPPPVPSPLPLSRPGAPSTAGRGALPPQPTGPRSRGADSGPAAVPSAARSR